MGQSSDHLEMHRCPEGGTEYGRDENMAMFRRTTIQESI